MRSDDLVPVLAPAKPQGLGSRQGVVVSWNQFTAENVVQVGGSLFEDLPCLNTSEASLLTAGDVVVVITLGSSWAVLGRLVIPGSPEAVTSIQSITNRIHVQGDASSGTRSPGGGFGDLAGGTAVGPQITVTVGPSGRVLAFWSCDLGETGNWQSNVGCNVSVAVSGASTVAASEDYALGLGYQHPVSPAAGNALAANNIQGAGMHVFTGLNQGSTTFTMQYQCSGATPSNPVTFRERELALFVL
jgi:hypothetical protein